MIRYCTGHYRVTYAKSKAAELRASGQYVRVRLGNYSTAFNSATGKNERYCQIYVQR